MVLSVDYSSKTICCFTAVVGFAVCTALFLRARGNRPAQPTAPSLGKERFSSMAGNSIVDQVNYYFNPTKAPLVIGHPFKPLKNYDELVEAFTAARKQHQVCETIVIYSQNLKICEDPRILELKPTKLILVGCDNYINFHQYYSTSKKCMVSNDPWCSTSVWRVLCFKANSVDEALNADPSNPSESQRNLAPYSRVTSNPTIYLVRTT